MDSISQSQHSLLELFSPEPGDLVFAALISHDHALFNPFGIEAPVVIPPTSTALATVPAPMTLLARLGALPSWQRGLLAAGAGLVLVYAFAAVVGVVGVKAAAVTAAAL